MRILVLSNSFPPHFRGGFEISANLITRELAKAGHTLTVLTQEGAPAPEDKDDRFEVHRVFKVKWSTSNASKWPAKLHGWILVNAVFRNGLINVPILRRQMTNKVFDFVICFNLEGIGAALATELKRQGIPVLWSLGDYWVFERLTAGLGSKLGELNRATFSKNQVRAETAQPWDYVIFISEWLRDAYVRAGYEPKHSFVVNRSCPEPLEVLEIDDPKRERDFLVASQLRHHKGTHIFVEALGILATDKECPQDWGAKLIGDSDPEYLQQLKDRVAVLGLAERVHFLGKVSHKESIAHFGRCLAFVHSALWEDPYARVTMEALAYAAPLISSNSGAVYEIPTAECCLIYDRNDPKALAACMKRILTEPGLAERLTERGRNRYLMKFTPAIEAANMKKVIDEVMAIETKKSSAEKH